LTASAQQRAAPQSRLASQTDHPRAARSYADATAQVSQIRERTELARTIGIAGRACPRAAGPGVLLSHCQPYASRQGSVRVQQFRILTADAATHTFTLRFALIRGTRPEETTTGDLGVTVDGERAGAATSLGLASMSTEKTKQLPYSFRYFTNMEQSVTLPADFRAERVTIEIRPAQRNTPPYRQTFVWNPDAT
jgi:hypothetical protein